ncbi:MAG: arginine--tRNA ligase [Patescibacteria group bacterium]|nr:arginine--tRNA ligase [Patescibacteria group bacterium]
MIEDKIRNEIISRIETNYPGVKIFSKNIEITRPDKPEFGDFSTNISFRIASQLKKKPDEVAKELAKVMGGWNRLEKAEAINGFLNIFLKKAMFHDILQQIIDEKKQYGNNDLCKGKKVQIEFISANPTGPLTLANGRGGFGGDVLANVYEKAGAKVEREYLVNDGGNQVKILGDSVLVAAGFSKEEEVYRGDYIDEWAKKNISKVKELCDKPKQLGQTVAQDILDNQIKKSVRRMKINFDNWFSEQKLIESGEVEKALADFEKKGLTYDKDGAVWFRTTKFGDDKDRVLIKADGENTYFANDVAYHWDKFAARKFDKVINFWGADHHGYIGRMQAATEAMGFDGQLKIVLMQLVRLIQDGKEIRMSKRLGNYVTMDELFEMIGGPVNEASDVARFFFLSRAFSTHMDFDLNMAREKTEKNPVFYVKYAYARLSGILRNAEKIKVEKANLSKLVAPEEIELIDELSQLESIVRSIILFDDYPVHFLSFYVQDIATKFHSFYDKCRVINEEDIELTAARLSLVEATKIVLQIVMEDLIGIEAPEKM